MSFLVVFFTLNLRIPVWYLELTEKIPPIAVTSKIAVFVFLLLFVKSIRRISLPNFYDWLSIFLLAYCVIVIMVNRYAYGDLIDLNERNYTIYCLVICFQSVLFYIVGRFFLIDSIKYGKLYQFSFVGVLVFIIANSKADPFGLSLENMTDAGAYLSFASMLAMYSIVVISCTKDVILKHILAFVAIVGLLMLHSRSSLFFFLVSYLFVVRKGMSQYVMIALTTVVTAPIFLMFYQDIAIDSRMVGIVTNPSEDSSLLSRLMQFQSGFSDVLGSPLKGEFGGQIKEFGYTGFYIHNIISYWRQFGILAFLLVIFLLVFLPMRIIRRGIGNYIYRDMFYMMFVYVLLNLLFSKAFEWYFLWMFVGFCSRLHENNLFREELYKHVFRLAR